MRRDSGPTQGLLMPESRTKTNFTTTQVSHSGSRVSSPVMNRRCNDARCGAGVAGVMARIVAPALGSGRGAHGRSRESQGKQGMRRSRVAVSVLVVVLALLGLVAWSVRRVLVPGGQEREALELVEAGPGPLRGRDGFADAYTARHDIREPQWQQVLEARVRRHAAVAGKGTAWASQLDDWPKLQRKAEGDPAWCSLRSSDCLPGPGAHGAGGLCGAAAAGGTPGRPRRQPARIRPFP